MMSSSKHREDHLVEVLAELKALGVLRGSMSSSGKGEAKSKVEIPLETFLRSLRSSLEDKLAVVRLEGQEEHSNKRKAKTLL